MVSNKKTGGFEFSDYAPKYRILAKHLRSQIRTGDYRPNGLFMSEAQLTQRFGVGMGNYVPQVNLTTVQTPLAQMGRIAARMLAGLVFDTFKGPEHVLVNDNSLIRGKTTGPPSVKAKKSIFR